MGKVIQPEIGTRYGMLVVKQEGKPKLQSNGKYASTSICICDCGKETTVLNRNLRVGKTKSCGCLRSLPHIKHNLSGQKYGRLFVVEPIPERNCGHVVYKCKCDCGKYKNVVGVLLTRGDTKSCGCYSREKTIEYNHSRKNTEFSAYNNLYKWFENQAKQRGIKFSLDRNDINKIIHQPCYYCGAENSNTHKYKKIYEIKHNGIDRIDSSKGYEIGNVVSCCKTCNFAKNTMSQSEFYEWILRVSGHLKLA